MSILVGSLLFGMTSCEAPFELPFSEVDRPDYENPVDPAVAVLWTDVLPRIPDDHFREIVQAEAIRQKAVFNTDINDLYVDTSVSPVRSLEGIQYLPGLHYLGIQDRNGTIESLAPLDGHFGISRLELRETPSEILATFPTLPVLQELAIQDVSSGSSWTVADLPRLNLRGFHAAGSITLTSIEGIDRLGPLEDLGIPRTGVPESELINELPRLAATLRHIDVDQLSNYSFLDNLPNIEGVGIVTPLLDQSTVQTLATYPQIVRFRFFGVGEITSDALLPLTGRDVRELSIDTFNDGTAANARVLDLSPLSSSPLEELRIQSGDSANPLVVLGIDTIPSTSIESMTLRVAGLSDAELGFLSLGFPILQRLDLSETAITNLYPLSTYASTLSALEILMVENVSTLAQSEDSNGVPELSVLPNLQYLNLRNTLSPTGANPLDDTTGISDLKEATNGRVFVEY